MMGVLAHLMALALDAVMRGDMTLTQTVET